jgi:hypothetical protein
MLTDKPCPCGESCTFPGSAYDCQRCCLSVCWCDGSDGAAICGDCWADLDRAGWTEGDMQAAYNSPDGGVKFPSWTIGAMTSDAIGDLQREAMRRGPK